MFRDKGSNAFQLKPLHSLMHGRKCLRWLLNSREKGRSGIIFITIKNSMHVRTEVKFNKSAKRSNLKVRPHGRTFVWVGR